MGAESPPKPLSPPGQRTAPGTGSDAAPGLQEHEPRREQAAPLEQTQRAASTSHGHAPPPPAGGQPLQPRVEGRPQQLSAAEEQQDYYRRSIRLLRFLKTSSACRSDPCNHGTLCKQGKAIIAHLATCRSRHCSTPYCAEARDLFHHIKHCRVTSPPCPICEVYGRKKPAAQAPQAPPRSDAPPAPHGQHVTHVRHVPNPPTPGPPRHAHPLRIPPERSPADFDDDRHPSTAVQQRSSQAEGSPGQEARGGRTRPSRRAKTAAKAKLQQAAAVLEKHGDEEAEEEAETEEPRLGKRRRSSDADAEYCPEEMEGEDDDGGGTPGHSPAQPQPRREVAWPEERQPLRDPHPYTQAPYPLPQARMPSTVTHSTTRLQESDMLSPFLTLPRDRMGGMGGGPGYDRLGYPPTGMLGGMGRDDQGLTRRPPQHYGDRGWEQGAHGRDWGPGARPGGGGVPRFEPDSMGGGGGVPRFEAGSGSLSRFDSGSMGGGSGMLRYDSGSLPRYEAGSMSLPRFESGSMNGGGGRPRYDTGGVGGDNLPRLDPRSMGVGSGGSRREHDAGGMGGGRPQYDVGGMGTPMPVAGLQSAARSSSELLVNNMGRVASGTVLGSLPNDDLESLGVDLDLDFL